MSPDLASVNVFVAGRESACSVHVEGLSVAVDGAAGWCPRGLDPESKAPWIRGSCSGSDSRTAATTPKHDAQQ